MITMLFKKKKLQNTSDLYSKVIPCDHLLNENWIASISESN